MVKMTIYDEQRGSGANPKISRINQKNVWCCMKTVGGKISFEALKVGVVLTNQVEMWAKEYDGQHYAEIGEKSYRIESAARTGSDLKIKLLLSRNY